LGKAGVKKYCRNKRKGFSAWVYLGEWGGCVIESRMKALHRQGKKGGKGTM